ncbi:MAG: winged helix-turn-helix domain-containing protein [Erythrobacter sp.]|uniref:winged helix-turn-helix domain-containing tetratricopeptide repeat protein n=1 Tax=Erythrobacter sp. TaxID=1042 RepID=UPI002609B28C|nr:winged helix-turn-helix domain-containing protein [Erythrobacter sp.]MDJ0978562.1 winged helix-turn-helix domain-containing protein [Erythrobacter sp.]
MIYQFGAFAFDTDRFELTDGDGKTVPMQPRTKDLLHLLLKKGTQRLLTKEEVVEALWGGRHVSEAALLSQIKRLRKAFGDTGRAPSVIATVYGKGWRLLPEIVSSMRVPASLQDNDVLSGPANSEPDRPSKIGERPSVAVLPFRLIGSIRSPLAGMGQGLPDDIIAALSRLRLLSVIARGTSFQFNGGAISPSALRKTLGVDYVLTGAIDVTQPRIVVTTELADARSESVVWTDRFEIEPQAIHEVRSQIVGCIVQEIERQIPRNEVERMRFTAPDDLTAWQSYHVGCSLIYRSGIVNHELAQRHFRRAVKIDRHFARAHAGLAFTYWWLLLQRTLNDPGDGPELMLRSAEAAIDADPDDPSANLAMGRALSLRQKRDQGLDWFARAIELSPSFAMAHTQMAAQLSLSGPFGVALEHSDIALALSPRDPMRYSAHTARAISLFNLGDIRSAAQAARKALLAPHEDLMVMVASMAIIFVAGHTKEAAAASERIRSIFPGTTIAGILHATPGMTDNVKALLQHVLSQNGFN